jgi:AcrR family transcriptional regulator
MNEDSFIKGVNMLTSKEKIIIAALNQFSRKGLSATRIQDIATEAGISQGLLYRYYKSKNEIYVDLIEVALDKMNEAVEGLHL